MQLKYLFCFFLLFFVAVGNNPGFAQQGSSKGKSAYLRLHDLLAEKDYFRLERQLYLLRQQIKRGQWLYFQAYLDNAFNRNQAAVQHIDSLFDNFSAELEDTLKVEMLLLKTDSYFKLFQYAKAAETDNMLLTTYRRLLESSRAEDIENKFIIHNGLKDVQPQQTYIRGNTELRWKRNKIGIVEIPLSRDSIRYDAIFDTRANISAITQTYATKLRLKILPVSYYEGSGITGLRFKTSLAVADSLYLGDILVRHAVFQVVPDTVLYIAPVDFQMNIIIGFPIIAQLHEIHFYQDGKMKIPVNGTAAALRNMALDGLNPVLLLKTTQGDILPFAFDFGAGRSMLFAAYFQKYRGAVLAHGVKTTTEYGGAGGTQQKEVLTLPYIDLLLDKKKVRLDSIDVLSQKIYPSETFYGNIGQDFIKLFSELTINFDDMYIKGR
ncbi:pepsin/retropepsin-like aspartic protease family protein [Chitinophaga rupis]|nr:retropepsin-like aspartic protease [Chitinophaga rupis]